MPEIKKLDKDTHSIKSLTRKINHLQQAQYVRQILNQAGEAETGTNTTSHRSGDSTTQLLQDTGRFGRYARSTAVQVKIGRRLQKQRAHTKSRQNRRTDTNQKQGAADWRETETQSMPEKRTNQTQTADFGYRPTDEARSHTAFKQKSKSEDAAVQKKAAEQKARKAASESAKKAAMEKFKRKAAQKRAAAAGGSAAASGTAVSSVTASGGAAASVSVGAVILLIVAMIIAVIMLVILVLLLCIGGKKAQEAEQARMNAAGAYASVSYSVLQYQDLIAQYAVENGIGRYVPLIEAIMMQESGGNGTNVMQVSHHSVQTPEDSIRLGVGYFRECLEMARVSDPEDLDHIKVALQGYNFGTGYITWLWANYDGVYSEDTAVLFAGVKAKELGWNHYGDFMYVKHVLRYYSCGEITVHYLNEGAEFAWPVPGHTNITSGYGARWGTVHKGVDISDGTIIGVPIVASKSGVITRADNYCTHNYPKDSSCGCSGGYGNRVEIDHGDGSSTLYGHMQTITVKVGQTVKQGQIIGYVGCTGHSTGYHLHFEIKHNGTAMDPTPYL